MQSVLESQLSAMVGIRSVSANPQTGTVLVVFGAHSSDSPATLVERIQQIVTQHNGREGKTEQKTSLGSKKRVARNVPGHQESDSRTGESKKAWLGGVSTRIERLRNQWLPQTDIALWHRMEGKTVLAALHSSAQTGLSNKIAKTNLQTYGPNILPEAQPRSTLDMLLDQVNSLPVALLTAAAGISVLTGGVADAVVILGVVAINAAIGYATESQAEKTIQSLKNLVRPSTLVVRGRKAQEVRAEEVVPGDLLVLKPGSPVAADARLLEAQHLSVDESALTGESLPVSKTTDPLTKLDLPLADRVNMVYMGTLVTGGQGLAVAIATGRFTELGKIQTLAGDVQAPETPLERQLDQMGRQLVLISAGVCALVFAVGLLRRYGFFPMLKTAISLAVAAVPEGLPTVATTTLALGVGEMRKHRVLIRRLDAVETLGCIQTICLDKTGTLTLNRMAVVEVCAGVMPVRVTDGQFRVGEEGIDPLAWEELARLLQVGVLCSETEITREDGQYVLSGSPTENALIHLALSAGMDVLALREQYRLVQLRLRSENRNFMSTVHAASGAASAKGVRRLVGVKGSPTEVLAMCDWRLQDGDRIPLTASDRQAIEAENERMAGDALRVLACAYRQGNGAGTGEEELGGLTWLGLVGMADPLRPGVSTVMRGFHRAGIETIMITGDQSPTAYAIGKELELSQNGHLEILDSTSLAAIDPEVLKALVEKVRVFARVSPAHKLQIVQALQRAGKVVAMTGDGINDGPALKAADIGIAMGGAGTDVAREVAHVVLEDDNLETMLVAVGQGRTIYQNIRKAVHFLLSTNLSELVVTATAISLGLGQPLSAIQLLWINLLSDIAPGLALALEPPDPDVLRQPPRDPRDPILKTADFRRIAREAAVLSAGSLGAYGYGLTRYGAGPHAGTLAFMSLTTSQLLHALTTRSDTRSIFAEPALPSNAYLNVALLGSFGLQVLSLIVPGLRRLLGIAPLSILDGVVIGSSTVLPFFVNEAWKHQETIVMPGQPEETSG